MTPCNKSQQISLITSSDWISEVWMRDCLQQMAQKHCYYSLYKEILTSPSSSQMLPQPHWAPLYAGTNGLKCVLLQFGKDVINFRPRTKVVQENSVHFRSEIFLRDRIILGNKIRGSVNGLPVLVCLSFPLPSFFPLSFLLKAQGKHSESIYEAIITGTLVFEVPKSFSVFSLYFKLKSFLLLKGC